MNTENKIKIIVIGFIIVFGALFTAVSEESSLTKSDKKVFYEEHKDEVAAINKAYYEANKEKISAKAKAKRLLKKQAEK